MTDVQATDESTEEAEGITLLEMSSHPGASIKVAADTYRKVPQVILECIQNSIDAKAKNIWVVINWKRRSIVVRDDGDGVTDETFRLAITNVGRSIKRGRGKYGKWGRGLVSPLGKCEYFTFTSQPKGAKEPYRKRTLNTLAIFEEEDRIRIPEEQCEDLQFARQNKKAVRGRRYVNWRTEVAMYNIITNKTIANVDINELVELAVDNFRVKMLQSDIELHISVVPERGEEYSLSVKAEPYSGEKLDDLRLPLPDDKEVRFNLYLARKQNGKYVGRVSFGIIADPFLLLGKDFFKSARSRLDSDVLKALSSGVFEGEIVSNVLSPVPERKAFADDDGLVKFCEALETWYIDIGMVYYEEAMDREESERFEKNAEATLVGLQKMLSDPQLKALADLVSSFPPNLNGVGVPLPTDQPGNDATTEASPQDTSTPAPTGAGGGAGAGDDGTGGGCGGTGDGSGSGTGGRGNSGTGSSKKPRPDRNGKQRTKVKVKNFGLRFEETEHLQGPWELVVEQGTLYFNTKHPLYMQCADHTKPDECIRAYQQFVAIQALSLFALPEQWREGSADLQDLELRSHVSLLTM